MKEGPREAEISQGQRSYKAVCEPLGTVLSSIPKTARPLHGLRVATQWPICRTGPRNTENTENRADVGATALGSHIGTYSLNLTSSRTS